MIATVDRGEEILHPIPHQRRVIKGHAISLTLEQLLRQQVERVSLVLVIRAVGQQTFVVGIGDEEQAEQRRQRHLISLVKLLPVRLLQPARRRKPAFDAL